MTTDLILAIVHHVLVFSLFGQLMAEAVLLRPGIQGADVARLARLDAGYGATAGLVLLVGASRVVWGAKGWAYYQDNHWFWAKMGCFALVAFVSILPTLRFVRWRRALRTDPAFAPDLNEVEAARRMVRLQGLLFILILAFAAAMARFT